MTEYHTLDAAKTSLTDSLGNIGSIHVNKQASISSWRRGVVPDKLPIFLKEEEPMRSPRTFNAFQNIKPIQGQILEKIKEAQQENYQSMLQRIHEEREPIDKNLLKMERNLIAIKKKKLGFSLSKNLNTGHNAGGVAFQGGSVTLAKPKTPTFLQRWEMPIMEIPKIVKYKYEVPTRLEVAPLTERGRSSPYGGYSTIYDGSSPVPTQRHPIKIGSPHRKKSAMANLPVKKLKPHKQKTSVEFPKSKFYGGFNLISMQGGADQDKSKYGDTDKMSTSNISYGERTHSLNKKHLANVLNKDIDLVQTGGDKSEKEIKRAQKTQMTQRSNKLSHENNTSVNMSKKYHNQTPVSSQMKNQDAAIGSDEPFRANSVASNKTKSMKDQNPTEHTFVQQPEEVDVASSPMVRNSTDSDHLSRISNLQRKAQEIQQSLEMEPMNQEFEPPESMEKGEETISPTSPNRKLAQQAKYLKDPKLKLTIKRNLNFSSRSRSRRRKQEGNIIDELMDSNYEFDNYTDSHIQMPKKSFKIKLVKPKNFIQESFQSEDVCNKQQIEKIKTSILQEAPILQDFQKFNSPLIDISRISFDPTFAPLQSDSKQTEVDESDKTQLDKMLQKVQNSFHFRRKTQIDKIKRLDEEMSKILPPIKEDRVTRADSSYNKDYGFTPIPSTTIENILSQSNTFSKYSVEKKLRSTGRNFDSKRHTTQDYASNLKNYQTRNTIMAKTQSNFRENYLTVTPIRNHPSFGDQDFENIVFTQKLNVEVMAPTSITRNNQSPRTLVSNESHFSDNEQMSQWTKNDVVISNHSKSRQPSPFTSQTGPLQAIFQNSQQKLKPMKIHHVVTNISQKNKKPEVVQKQQITYEKRRLIENHIYKTEKPLVGKKQKQKVVSLSIQQQKTNHENNVHMRYPSGVYNQIGLLNPNNKLNKNIWNHIKSPTSTQKVESEIAVIELRPLYNDAGFSPVHQNKSGFVSFMGTNLNEYSRNASPGDDSNNTSFEYVNSGASSPLKMISLIQKDQHDQVEWFESSLMENENEQFTLGFQANNGHFWIKNKNNNARFIDINLDAFIRRGAEIEEILGYITRNIQHDITSNSNSGLGKFLAGELNTKAIKIMPAAKNLLAEKNHYSKMSSNFNLLTRRSNNQISEPSLEKNETPTLVPTGSEQEMKLNQNFKFQ